jgi:hypothetical protein
LAGNPSLDEAIQPQLLIDNDELRSNIIYTIIELASNPALTKNLQAQLAEDKDERIVASLAKNPTISESLMNKLVFSDSEQIRAGLASNPCLPESLQARLIAGNSYRVSENMARNVALKVAQQAQLAHVGNVDVRLALLENPQLDSTLKKRVTASFTTRDLTSVEHALEYANTKATQLYSEHHEAMKKCLDSYNGFFTPSQEKVDSLNRAADNIQKLINEADREIRSLEIKNRKINALIKNQAVAI